MIAESGLESVGREEVGDQEARQLAVCVSIS
jgi:hypothetical protein